MQKQDESKQFTVEVDGIGTYVFRRRSLADTFKVRTQYAQLTGGHYDEQGRMADLGALALATIKVLSVAEPPDFKVSDFDPLLGDMNLFEKKLMAVYVALVAKEGSFRPRANKDGTEARAADGGEGVSMVPQDLPARAD